MDGQREGNYMGFDTDCGVFWYAVSSCLFKLGFSLRRDDMEKIAKALRKAYWILHEAQMSGIKDLDEAYLAIEEANGYVAEALDLVDESDFIEIPK